MAQDTNRVNDTDDIGKPFQGFGVFVASLNSGSNGNCYYIGNGQEAVLIDAGLSCRETEKRMRRLGLKMDTVKAIFISHEHGDHIRGVEGLAAKHQLPVYITAATLHHSRMRISPQLVHNFKAYEPVSIGALNILAFPKLHDAADPHSFVITVNNISIGVFTDIGSPCDHVISNFKHCHAVFLETNYDESMLQHGKYPPHLKKRISGTHGHLSNTQALELFISHRPAHMSHLFLSHLSKDNNAPELAHQLFTQNAGDTTHIILASRYEETAVYNISLSNSNIAAMQPSHAFAKMIQASLF